MYRGPLSFGSDSGFFLSIMVSNQTSSYRTIGPADNGRRGLPKLADLFIHEQSHRFGIRLPVYES